MSLYDVLAAAAGATGTFRDDQQMIATALVTLNGKTARVRRDGHTGNTLLSYRDTFPADLAPLLVLDASGRVRQTYSCIEQHRESLVRLKPAVKDYSPLTIHARRTAGSKSGFERQGGVLAKGIAEPVLTKPTEDWLVVVHKASGRVRDVEAAIRRNLRGQVKDGLKVITWGQHLATNAYADVPNVILAGTLFMKESFYTALTHLAQGRDVGPGLASPAEVAETMRGEHRHLVYQAICRGRVRRSDGGKCQPMTAYVIASSRSGIPKDLTTIFPGCSVVPWEPLKRPLSGPVKRALVFVEAALGQGEEWIPLPAIRVALRMDPSNFRKRVTSGQPWKEAITSLGLAVTSGPGRVHGLRRSLPVTAE